MYGRRRMPIARTALLVGVTGSVARNAARQENMASENAYYRDQARQQEMNQQAQMQAQQQAQMQAQQAQQQAAATEEAVRRGIAQAEEARRRSEQQPPPYQGPNNGQYKEQNSNVQAVMNCDRCKQPNQVTSSFCSNCGNKLLV
jgi:uncharacterized iron-regulated membrane protein